MIIGLFLVDNKGDLIISICEKPEISKSVIDLFKVNIICNRIKSELPPINQFEKYHFVHCQISPYVYIVDIVHKNSNVASIVEFNKAISKIIRSLCNNVKRHNIEKKSSIFFEMMDECMTYGLPQVTDLDVLQTWMFQKGFNKKKNKKLPPQQITNSITGQINWRKVGIKYTKHEMFISVIEKINFIMSSTGSVLSQSVDGSIIVKSTLSGMPECRCGVNDKIIKDTTQPSHRNYVALIQVDDYTFHQCVQLTNYESEKVINFIPPDGKFELMKYRTTNDIHIPFNIITSIKNGNNQSFFEINIVLKSLYASSLYASDIKVSIPTPSSTVKATTSQLKGTSKYKKADNLIIWNISKMYGDKEHSLNAIIDLFINEFSDQKKREFKLPPITLQFKAPFSCSGMSVRYIKLMEPKLNYTDKDVIKWIRYISSEGKYEFRI